MTKAEKRIYEQKRRASGIARGIGSSCVRGNHSKCKGMRQNREQHMMMKCECHCHLHVCPRCKQPTIPGFRKAIRDAASSLESQAKQIRKYVDCVEVRA